jgi:hypothetical protein
MSVAWSLKTTTPLKVLQKVEGGVAPVSSGFYSIVHCTTEISKTFEMACSNMNHYNMFAGLVRITQLNVP